MPVLAEIAANGDRIVLGLEYGDNELAKQLPGARFDGQTKYWHAPLSWGTCKALRGLFDTRLAVGPNLTAWAWDELEKRVRPALALRRSADAPGWGPEGLRPDQRVGVAMLVTGKQVLLGDDMGTGKTVMGAVALDYLKKMHVAGPYLVVCPNTVKRGWERELAKWAPSLRVVVVRGSATKRRQIFEAVRDGDYDVAIMNWENLRLHSRLAPYGSTRLRPCSKCVPGDDGKPQSCERCPRELNDIAWGAIIADEAHRAKDPKAKQTRALWAVAHGHGGAQYRWALTGTPIADAMDDFWSIGHFLVPEEYPRKTQYLDRYGLLSYNAFGGMEVVGIRPETRDEFFSIFDPRFLRRPRSYSLKDVKEPQRETRFVEMSPKQAKLYKELAKEMIGELDDGSKLVVPNPLTQTTRLNQAAASYLEKVDCSPCGATGGKPLDPSQKCDNCGGRGFLYVPTLPSNKVDGLLELLDELPPKEQVVVFAVSRKLLERTQEVLTAKGVTNVIISGAVTEQNRYVAVDQFRAGQARVCLVVIDAGGEGLDGLQVAQIGVFMQRHYSRLKNHQAEGRLVRGGQEGQAVLIDLRSEGTIEDDKEAILAEKEGRFEELVRDRDTLRALIARSAGL